VLCFCLSVGLRVRCDGWTKLGSSRLEEAGETFGQVSAGVVVVDGELLEEGLVEHSADLGATSQVGVVQMGGELDGLLDDRFDFAVAHLRLSDHPPSVCTFLLDAIPLAFEHVQADGLCVIGVGVLGFFG
jgi:hypothetical protein